MSQPDTNRDEIASAQIVLPSNDVRDDLPFFTKVLGFRLDEIYPADDPVMVVMSGHGVSVRLEKGAGVSPGILRLACHDPDNFANGARVLHAPNGTKIEIVEANPPLVIPPTEHSFIVRPMIDADPWVIGRAGMHYRDLVPGRLGGSIIASHIRIMDAGPVPDMVHYHTVGFQLIFCYRGWVRLVYEDQGEPFILNAGDCVIQPPKIRHRVLESSGNLEVIEIGVPADHVTTIDHVMELPTNMLDPERDFDGQRFIRHELKDAAWIEHRLKGFECRDTGIGGATDGVANVQVARVKSAPNGEVTSHSSDILFSFVMEGCVTLACEDGKSHQLKAGDAYVIPPLVKTAFSNGSDDLEILEVSLPGSFETKHHEGAL